MRIADGRPHAALRRRREALRSDRGYSVVEAAITLPAMILLTMMVVQWAIMWHLRHVVESAAQEGVRSAESYQSSAAAGRADALNFLHQVAPQSLTDTSVRVDRTATMVTVHVRGKVRSVIPFGSFDVEATVSGPVENYVP